MRKLGCVTFQFFKIQLEILDLSESLPAVKQHMAGASQGAQLFLSQLAIKFEIYTNYQADFSEIVPAAKQHMAGAG